jgi:hypothetical protein
MCSSSLLLPFIITIFVKWTFITIAFLCGHLKEEIYFEQLESYISPHDEFKVCWLLKSLYGLKQALHVWYAPFNAHLLNIRYIQCFSYTNFYIVCTRIFFIIIGIYVDNLVIVSNNLSYLKDSKTLLAQEFTMTKNVNIEYCLGIQIEHDWTCKIFFLLQEKYIYDILHKFHMETCKPIAILLSRNILLLILRKPSGYDNYLRTWVLFEMVQHGFAVIIDLRIKLIQNSCFHDRCKHIELQFHFLQEKVWSLKIETSFHINWNQWADIYYKIFTHAQACTLL